MSEPPPTSHQRRIAVLISGSELPLAPPCPHRPRPLQQKGRIWPHARGTRNPPIPTAYLGLQPFLKANPGKTRDDYDVQVACIVARAKPDLVVLAGWMHIMGDGFLDVVNGDRVPEGEDPVARPIPVINLHPALPGAFDGAHAIERAYEAFQKGQITHSGVMVHRVVKEVDRGTPVIVRQVEIKPGEPIEAFEERLHKIEWEIIVQGTAAVLDEVAPVQPPSM
ncbi:phosphoribosylglycinamide formyltransferase [Amylocystis lapponica]|nr:phosphoribosylglycinamide formyltransferase [Amylocystis lapponica]